MIQRLKDCRGLVRKVGNRGRIPGQVRCCEPDEIGEAWNGARPWDAEAVAEDVVVDLELRAGLHQTEHGVAGDLTRRTDGPSGDLAFGDDGADVVFGAVGVERDLRPVEDAEQLGFYYGAVR